MAGTGFNPLKDLRDIGRTFTGEILTPKVPPNADSSGSKQAGKRSLPDQPMLTGLN